MSTENPRASRRPLTLSPWVRRLMPVAAAAVAAGATWGVGMTVFHDELVRHGQPSAVAAASEQTQQWWRFGAQLADLSTQSQHLAAMTGEADQAQALKHLSQVLASSALLVGELRFDNDEEPAKPMEYSAQTAADLALQAAQLSASVPNPPEQTMESAQLVAALAFSVNRAAQQVLASSEHRQDTAVPGALQPDAAAAASPGDEESALSCLSDPLLLQPAQGVQDPELVPSTAAARALDRGYALDYVLQVAAARSTPATASGFEAQRAELDGELEQLRSLFDPQCADLRLAAYTLPGTSLDELQHAVESAQSEYAAALMIAAAALDNPSERSTAARLADEWLGRLDSQQIDLPLMLAESGK